MDDLLPYYEHELGLFRQYTREFSQRYPKTAGKLLISGENSEDPHIEQLIQSCALLTARVTKRLDSDFPKFTESMLESLYPHYLRPLPSHSIAQIGGRDGEISDTVCIVPRGSKLMSPPVQGVMCQFQTCYAVTLAPILISAAHFNVFIDEVSLERQLPPGAGSEIRITLEGSQANVDFHSLPMKTLRVFVDGEPSLRAQLIDTFFMRGIAAFVRSADDGPWHSLQQVPLKLVGLHEHDGMLPCSGRSHPAFRLLTEYFTYPEKFNFIDIDLAAIVAALPGRTGRVTLLLALRSVAGDSKEAKLLASASHRNFLLGCTPVINLFEKRGVPIQLNHTSSDYPLIADGSKAAAYEIHSVSNVRLVRDTPNGNSVTDFAPLYGSSHDRPMGAAGNYWLTRRDPLIAAISPGHETRISLIDAEFTPSDVGTATLSSELICTNRELPLSLRYGQADGDLTTDAVPTAMPIRLLRKPTRSYRFKADGGAHWRLITHLTLNLTNLTNTGVGDLQKMLALYDLPRSASSQRQIGGVLDIEIGTVRAWMATLPVSCLMPGIGIRVTVDEQAFVGSGLYIFGQVLDQYFALHSQLNCFTQLEIISAQSGKEILKCQPRSAEKMRA